MFVFDPEHKFSWKVEVSVPMNGKLEKQSFTATYKVLKQNEIDELLKLPTAEYDLAQACLVGWAGITGENKKPIAYSSETATELLALPYVRQAVIATYLKALAGAPEKN